MNFLQVPVEVIDGSVLPYLKWNDLLRFRRVCKVTKDIADGYLKVHPELGPEIEINEDSKNLREFLGLTVPTTTRLFINNASGIAFYINAAGEDSFELLERLGLHVKHLRVNQLSESLFAKEWNFLEAMVNLESFEVDKVLEYKKVEDTSAMNETMVDGLSLQEHETNRKISFGVLEKLKVLKIKNDKDVDASNLLEIFKLFLSSRELRVAALPFSTNITVGVSTAAQEREDFLTNPIAVAFLMINGHIRQRSITTPPGTTNLKVFDFTSYHHNNGDEFEQAKMELLGSAPFLILCGTCLTFDVKLRNVGASWLQARSLNEIPGHGSPELGKPVLSLVSLHPSVFPLNMPNLERVEIRSTSQSSPGDHWREERPDWPSLKTLHITVDSLRGEFIELNRAPDRIVNHQTSTKNLLKFFFEDISREALTELHLKFTKGAGSVVIPKAEDIVSSCPNLRKLTLINWPGTNKALTVLWKGLPDLEEVSLENCNDSGNVAFVGEDANSPVFLRLTKLRKLSLRGLDVMPKITDTLFSLVIRNLKLTHLTLTSEDPVKSVTVAGIRYLLDGRFAESIEKFSFQNWSLATVSPEEFKVLEQDFRSYYMM